MLAINRRLTNLFKETFFKTCNNLNNKLYATESGGNGGSSNNDNDDSNEIKPIDFPLTESLPPIPPNYGWVGDDNLKSLFEINKIRNSFKYGNPPKMKRKFIKGPPVIRLLPIQNCSNRRFYRIAVTRLNSEAHEPFIEDLGSIDPMPNKDNQILIALNIERIKYYLSKSVPVKGSVGPILGLAGILPLHPETLRQSYRLRKQQQQPNNESTS